MVAPSAADSFPPKQATAYAAMIATDAHQLSHNPIRQPRAISKRTGSAANTTKIVCQSGEPAAAGDLLSKYGIRNAQSLVGAGRDRKARARSSLRPSGPRAAERRDRDDLARRSWFLHRDAVTVFCSREIVAVGLNATRKTMSSPLLMPP